MKTVKYVSINGDIVPNEEAKVHIQSPAFRYGLSVFEGIRAYWDEPNDEIYVFRLKNHIRRLNQSMALMKFEHSFTEDQIINWFLELIHANGVREDIHARVVAFIDGSGPLWSTSPVSISMALLPAMEPKTAYTCCVSSWTKLSERNMPPRIKCNANYINSRNAILEAKGNSYDDAILLNEKGKVSESSLSAFFIIRNNVPTTASYTSDVLESITVQTLIELFEKEMNLATSIREIDRTELYISDEAFLCGSAVEIIPVVSIDQHPIGEGQVGPVTKAVHEIYGNVVRGRHPAYQPWLTPVYHA